MMAAGNRQWIVVRNWEKFQHYKDREPPWIKAYLELEHDDAYRELTLAARGLLHDIWLQYASARGVLTGDAAKLGRLIGQRVYNTQVISLVQAGFIEISDSKPLAFRYQDASTSRARERERERNKDLGAHALADQAPQTNPEQVNGVPADEPPPDPEALERIKELMERTGLTGTA